MSRVRIVTYNIAHGRGLNPIQGTTGVARLKHNLRRIGDLLMELDPDVVALQEIDQKSRWAGNFDQLDYLSRYTGMPYSVFGIHNRREGLMNLAYGNGLLSKHPILVSETVSFGQQQVGEKGFIFAELDLNGRRLPIVNLHLHYRSKSRRFKQLDMLLDFLREKRRAHSGEWPALPIVCGDFNTPQTSSDVTAALGRHLQDMGAYTLHPRKGRTFPSPLPVRLLDFVFVPPQATTPFCRVVNSKLSDHRPVMVEFELN